MAASIITLRPLTRQQGIQIPGVVQAPSWLDNVTLAGGTAQNYVLPTDAAGNHATILGLSSDISSVPLYLNFQGTAAANSSTTSTGSASLLLRTDKAGPYRLAVPDSVTSVSLFSTSNCNISVEAWK